MSEPRPDDRRALPELDAETHGDGPDAGADSASGSSPTAWAATPRARSAASPTRRYHGLLIAALPAPLGPDDDAQPARRAARPAPTARSMPLGVEALAGRPVARGRRPDRRVPPRGRACPSGGSRSAASSWRSGSSCRTSRTRSTSPTGSSAAGEGEPVRLDAPAAGPLPLARRAGRRAAPRPVPVHRLGRPLRDLAPGRRPAACG